MRVFGQPLVVAAALMTAACTGLIGDADDQGPGVGPPAPEGGGAGRGGATSTTGSVGPIMPGAGVGPIVTSVDPNAAGPMPLRRLTRREYNNTVRDLLGDATRPANQFPPDKGDGFAFPVPGVVATQDALLLRSAAETLAANAAKNLAAFVPCNPGSGDDACARGFVQTFGLRAYRRPLAPADVDGLMVLYSTARAQLGLGFAAAVVLVIEGILQSPEFLYHWEVAPGPTMREGALVKLDPYHLASRLSYFLWGTMPDKVLFDAAAAGKLTTAAEVDAQARRMIADPRARETVATFFHEWLDLDALDEQPKDPKAYPEYNDGLRHAMLGEARSFVESVVFDGDGRLGSLLLSSVGFVNQALGTVYGMTQVRGTAMQRVELNATQRQGFLTRAAFLTLNGSPDGSNPVRRGHAVYEKLLCRTLPPPPPDVPDVKPPTPGMTTRQRFAEHARMECARGCHALIDPIGFAFENYDGIGRYRTSEASQPIDATGSIHLDAAEHPFADALALNRLLAKSTEVRRCLSTQWLRYALSRPEGGADGAAIEAGLAALAAKDGDTSAS